MDIVASAPVQVLPAVYPHPVRTEWKMLVQLRVDNPGTTMQELAKQLGVNWQTIRLWSKNPLYQSYENWFLKQVYESQPLDLKMSRADVKVVLDEFAEEMLFRLKDIVETSGDEKLIANIGFDMLDRAGYEAPKRDGARAINVMLTPELIALLAKRSSDIDRTNVVVGEVVA